VELATNAAQGMSAHSTAGNTGVGWDVGLLAGLLEDVRGSGDVGTHCLDLINGSFVGEPATLKQQNRLSPTETSTNSWMTALPVCAKLTSCPS
jgi:hypothetical protein